ncbi:unnamed protein product [Phytomonas sp. Hart1]|nr:unnamed protein product [Phytomonas sp. Hart1]|eukprot:CCW66643.1 unnamed protein product [Phytomonas sp. isolate Hart1]
MAQWIPKTAWKVSNLNKRYGRQYLLKGYPNLESGESFLSSYTSLHDEKSLGKASMREKIMKALQINEETPFPEAFIIDLRDRSEREHEPLNSRAVLVLHVHDILSGAALPILPERKSQTEIFLVASNAQRGVNGAAAIRRWGYQNVSVLDAATICDVINNTEKCIEKD